MNQRIDFSNIGGFPATQYTTDYMQASYRNAMMALAGFIGDKVILTGCQIVGDVITNGWLSINGELVPFVGGPGTSASSIGIVESNETRLFQDNSSHAVYFKRQAQITVPGSFLYSDLKNMGTLKDIVSVPAGIISMWSGAIANIPAGWALCDGTNGTPNLSGMFIAGYNAADADYNAIGKTGGAKSVILTKAQLPASGLKILNPFGGSDPYYVNDTSGGGTKNSLKGDNDNGNGSGYITTENMGSGQGHENRPPFYTLAYIIKL